VSDVELLTIGRVNFDLYAQEPGVEFVDVNGWDAMVGGSPTNVAIAASRLGIRSALISAVGDDPVGDWVLAALDRDGVDTRYVARKAGKHTSLALRAQLAPDHRLAFYRHDPADIHVNLADVPSAPVETARSLLVSADALARGTMRETCSSVIDRARRAGVPVYLDLDLRDVNWPDLSTYADVVGATLPAADVIIGTAAEFAACLHAPDQEPALVAQAVRFRAPRAVVVVKDGERGATLFEQRSEHLLAPYVVREASTIGAGDSFAAGLIFARLRGLAWANAGAFASACAAITVSRYGCSDGLPRLEEVLAFLGTGTRAMEIRS
jgi:5-dehydro-2-deoxygluconokinase